MLIYVNHLPNALSATPGLFADDTGLVIHAANPIILSEKMNLELQNVYTLTEASKITLNPEKSHELIIPPKSTHQISSVKGYMYKSPLKAKDFVKYLGVTVDSRLNFPVLLFDFIPIICLRISSNGRKNNEFEFLLTIKDVSVNEQFIVEEILLVKE